MTKLSMRLAAFAFGLGVALPTVVHAERQCWVDARGMWMCAPAPHPEWREEHRRDWHPVPLHEERRWDHKHE